MALFEYDAGHLIPAQFGRPVNSGGEQEVLSSVRRQVLEVIARPLFPVTWNDAAPAPEPPSGMPQTDRPAPPPTNGEPRLTALDGSGQVVSIEVLERLDAQSLIGALARLGAASSLGWNELAASYPGGVAAFRSGWTQFRDSMPPRQDPGPRLILVAAEIDPQVRPALQALSASGLEVHQLSVREMSNGRRFLDVQRVHSTLFTHDPNLLPGRAARIPELSAAVGGISVTPTESTVSEECVQPAEPKPATAVPDTDSSAVTENAPAPAVEPVEQVEPVDPADMQTGSISRRSIMEAVRGNVPSSVVEPGPEPCGPDYEPVPPCEENTTVPDDEVSELSAGAQTPPLGTEVAQAVAQSHVSTTTPDTGIQTAADQADQAERADAPAKPQEDETAALLRHDAQGLATLAQIVGSDTPLYWTVNLDGTQQVITAYLKTSGQIQMEGRDYTDPSELCAALGQRVDGWESWCMGDPAGPSLAEACAEMNQEIKRANQGHRRAQHS